MPALIGSTRDSNQNRSSDYAKLIGATRVY